MEETAEKKGQGQRVFITVGEDEKQRSQAMM